MQPDNIDPTSPLAQLDSLVRERASVDPTFASLIVALGRWLMSCGMPEGSPARSGPALPSEPPTPIEPPSVTTEAMADAVASRAAPEAPASSTQAPAAAPGPEEPSPPKASPAALAALAAKLNGAVSPKRTEAMRPAAPTRSVETKPTLQSLAPSVAKLELKADACAWAIRRAEANADGRGFAAVKPEYEALRARAGAPTGCYLWMLERGTEAIDVECWRLLQGCYRACAETLAASLEFRDRYIAEPTLAQLLCSAQSALNGALLAVKQVRTRRDEEQAGIHEWCHREAKSRNEFFRHMSGEDPFDPARHDELRAAVLEERERILAQRQRERAFHNGLDTIRHHVHRLEIDAPDADVHWRRIGDGIEACRTGGMAASHPDLITVLASKEWISEDMPDAIASRRLVAETLRYVDERIAARQAEEPEAPLPRREATPRTLLARARLAGTTVVLVGGDERPHSRRRIEAEFHLGELKWLASREHSSIEQFRAAITHPDTVLVLLMIRWASHSYEDLQEICESAGKTFVRLPGGYNPSQIAHQIVEQASEQLGIDSKAT